MQAVNARDGKIALQMCQVTRLLIYFMSTAVAIQKHRQNGQYLRHFTPEITTAGDDRCGLLFVKLWYDYHLCYMWYSVKASYTANVLTLPTSLSCHCILMVYLFYKDQRMTAIPVRYVCWLGWINFKQELGRYFNVRLGNGTTLCAVLLMLCFFVC